MKVIKAILLIVGIIVAVFLIVPIFLPGSYSVERSILIDRSPAQVFPHVVQVDHWQNWDPWTPTDPTVKTAVEGTVGELGSAWTWDGEGIGKGRLVLAEIEQDKALTFKLIFEEPNQMEATDSWSFEPEGQGTRVTWKDEGEGLAYPMDRWVGLFLPTMLGGQFETGLNQLKEVVETE